MMMTTAQTTATATATTSSDGQYYHNYYSLASLLRPPTAKPNSATLATDATAINTSEPRLVARVSWLVAALGRATRRSDIEELLEWHYELLGYYPLPCVTTTTTAIMPHHHPLSSPPPPSSSLLTNSESDSDGDNNKEGSKREPNTNSQVYKQTLMVGVARPTLVTNNIGSGGNNVKTNVKAATRLSAKANTSSATIISSYREEALYWLTENQQEQAGKVLSPDVLAGCHVVLSYLLMWQNYELFRGKSYLTIAKNRIARALGLTTAQVYEYLTQLEHLGLILMGKLASGLVINQTEFECLKQEAYSIYHHQRRLPNNNNNNSSNADDNEGVGRRVDANSVGRSKSKMLSRAIQTKSVFYRLKFQPRTALPEFKPFTSYHSSEEQAHEHVTTAKNKKKNTLNTLPIVQTVPVCVKNDLPPRVHSVHMKNLNTMNYDDNDKINSSKCAKAKETITATAPVITKTTTTPSQNQPARLLAYLTPEERSVYERLMALYRTPSTTTKEIRSMDAGEAYRLARVYNLEYVEAKLKVWQTLLGLGDGDDGGNPVIRPTIKNPIGYLHTILTRDIELPPTATTPLSGVAAAPLRRLANPTTNNNNTNNNDNNGGSRWHTNNNSKRVVAGRSTSGKDRLATTKAFLARYDEAVAAVATNPNITTITPSIPTNYDKGGDTAINDATDDANKTKDKLSSLFTATRVNAPCNIPKHKATLLEETRLGLEPVWQDLLKEDLAWGHNRLKSDQLDLLIGSQLLVGSLELELEKDPKGQTVEQAQTVHPFQPLQQPPLLQLTLKLSDDKGGWQAERLSLTSRSAIKFALRQKFGISFVLAFT